MKGTFYVTTPIYYINSEPHIGSAYTTIVADVVARYKRLDGYDVFFLTGTDEHGQKVLQAAEARGMSPQQFCDELAGKFKKLWEELKITNNYFVRTTDETHMKTVQYFIDKMKGNGDIYKGQYEGWYCVPCETFWTEEDVGSERICPSCGREVKKVKEENYFFRLSKYNDALLKLFKENPEFVQPDFRRNEMLKILEDGLRDLSITRTSFKWGVPMPDDPEHVIYVWVDALINYISAIGYPHDMEKFEKYWPADVHLIGKEINRFHSLIWPAMLMSAGLPLPKQIFAHGWLTVNGQKISKSLGNAIDPREFVKTYGNDAVRYYLLKDIQFGRDGDFSEENLITRINADLANDLGNLLHRTQAMIKKFNEDTIPEPGETDSVDENLIALAKKTITVYREHMDKLKFTQALEAIWELVKHANKYIDLTEPWKLGKLPEKKSRLNTVLYNLAEVLRLVSLMIAPITPDTSNEILKRLGTDVAKDFESLEWGRIEIGSELVHGLPLFPRIDPKEHRWVSKAFEGVTNEKAQAEESDNLIEIGDFARVELRVGKILEAEKINKSKKLLKLQMDLGDLGRRQIVAGIAQHYEPEELIGLKVVVVTNLKPVKLMGEESKGMLLAAKDGKKLTVLTVQRDIEPGAKIS
ncbi:methionyl-tRNA synthetase [Kosmotoga arenicorallina S304]|uniref:Methionine--tRNA ligase n=1 Tax=Kosmotoga arenicorallina S304 TaxID=1453497 RepID=A0A182C8N0_9BACT|nr:methionine--tRNA ligase [Kosmotoga arenicorallina]OAA31909.1 methionyl-tRNA synthetase [Kosmotoga arenicorallina S304]